MVYICRKCRRNLPELYPKLRSCHFCHTYYCSKLCRQNDLKQHQSKCIGAQASRFCKDMLRTIITSNDTVLITKLCKLAYDSYCIEGRGCLLLNFKDLDSLAAATSVKKLIEKELSYTIKSKLPVESKKIRKAINYYNPHESIILGICLHVPLKNMDLTKKEAGRSYRENNVKLIEAYSIMINVESDKFRNWWILKCAAVNEHKKRLKNRKGQKSGDDTLILKGIEDKNCDTVSIMTGGSDSTIGGG